SELDLQCHKERRWHLRIDAHCKRTARVAHLLAKHWKGWSAAYRRYFQGQSANYDQRQSKRSRKTGKGIRSEFQDQRALLFQPLATGSNSKSERRNQDQHHRHHRIYGLRRPSVPAASEEIIQFGVAVTTFAI